VRRHLVDLVVLLVIGSAVAGYLLLTEPAWRSIVLRIYVFVVGGLAMLALVAAAGDAVPRRHRSELELALREHEVRERPLPELERLQREVTLACAAAFDFHHRLLPQLREIAQARLERTGRTPGPETLGRWWELLRPDRESPEERFGAGIKLDELRELVHDLERIG
jgi:uncharacterized membrane protein